MQDSFGKPEITRFCYHTTCDLSCASVTVHDVRNVQGRIYMLMVFTVLRDVDFTLCY